MKAYKINRIIEKEEYSFEANGTPANFIENLVIEGVPVVSLSDDFIIVRVAELEDLINFNIQEDVKAKIEQDIAEAKTRNETMIMYHLR
jgi:hypothetical protein